MSGRPEPYGCHCTFFRSKRISRHLRLPSPILHNHCCTFVPRAMMCFREKQQCEATMMSNVFSCSRSRRSPTSPRPIPFSSHLYPWPDPPRCSRPRSLCTSTAPSHPYPARNSPRLQQQPSCTGRQHRAMTCAGRRGALTRPWKRSTPRRQQPRATSKWPCSPPRVGQTIFRSRPPLISAALGFQGPVTRIQTTTCRTMTCPALVLPLP